jgi:hypothetical protein
VADRQHTEGDHVTTDEEQTYTAIDLRRAYNDGMHAAQQAAHTEAMNRVADATERGLPPSPTLAQLIRQHALSWAAQGRTRWWRSGRATQVLADAKRYEQWVRDGAR